jgi:hypothetical protein
MFVKRLTIMFCLVPLIAWGQNRAPFGPPGYQLPDRVTPENLDEVYQAISRDKCKTPDCTSLRIAIVQILTNTSQRHSPGTVWTGRPPNIPYGAIKAKDIDDSLRPIRAIWPDICRAVVEIGARDDFVHGHETYSWIATAALDVARHLTRPGLDCLGKALAAMPQSKFLQGSMAGAWGYCLDERRGAARCARLKPSDPDFLPAPPMLSVP